MTPAPEGNTSGLNSVDDLPTVSGPTDTPLASTPPVTPAPAPTPTPVFGESRGSGSTASQAADEGKQVASHAADQAKTVASEAAYHGKQLASEAGGVAKELVGTVKEQAVDLRHEVRNQTRTVVDQTVTQLSEQAQSQTERAGQALRTFSDQAAALAEGRTDEAGELSRYAQQVSDQLRQVSLRLEEGGFEGVLGDVQRFARRRPGAFLLGAAALGLLAGRVGRGVKDAGGNGSSSATTAQLPAVTGDSYTTPSAAPPVSPTAVSPDPLVAPPIVPGATGGPLR